MRNDGQLGHKLGPRLAAVMAQATVAARAQLAPHEARVRAAGGQHLIDRMGQEAADHYAPLLDAMPDDANIHPALAAFIARSASGKHQWQAAGEFIFSTSGIGGALGGAIANAVAPAVYALNETGPNLNADASVWAAATATGVASFSEGQSVAYKQGLGGGNFQIMVDLATAKPDPGLIGEMVNRGLLSEADAEYWLGRAAWPTRLHHALLGLRQLHLSPADAALAVLRGVIDQARGDAIAADAGMSAADLQVLQGNTGEPPSPESLMEGLRRGFIDLAQFNRGIRQSRVRDEWIPFMAQLRLSPMSTADAVAAVVQNYLPDAEGRAIAEQNGLEPSHWQFIREAAGEPLSLTEMTELWRRGEVGQADVEQALRESRLKDKYIASAIKLRVRIPEPRQVITALERGAATQAQALKALRDYGYDQATAEMLLHSGLAGKRTAVHHLAVGQVTRLYEDHLIDRAKAAQLLTGLGWSAEDAEWLLRIADLNVQAKLQAQAVNTIRSKYVARHLDLTQATAALDQLDVAAAQRGQLLHLWDIERASNVRVLTEAQVVAAVKKQLLTATQGHERLIGLGYDTGDANILLGVAPGAPLPS